MAAEAAEAQLRQLSDAGVARGAAAAARALVESKASVGRLEQAGEALSAMARRFEASGDQAALAESLLALATLHSAKNETDKALKALKDAPAMSSLGAASRELEPHYLKLLVSVQLAREASLEAKKAATDMLQLAQGQSDKAMQAAAWSALASAGALQARDEDGSPSLGEEAMRAADKALSLYQESGDRQGQAAAQLAAARTRLAINRATEGLATAQDSLELCKELGQTKGMVSALEVIIQAHSMAGNPMAGLRAANAELERARQQGDKAAQADLLDMMAHTHATLREPVSATMYAKQALQLHHQLGDRSGSGWALHTVAEMQRAQGQMKEAEVTVKEAQACFQAAGDRLGQEQALWTLSLLMAVQGNLEKAPGRKEVKQALRKFSRAIQDRKADEFKEAEDTLEKCKELLIEGELHEYLRPLVEGDEGSKGWLKEQGWDLDGPPEGVPQWTGTKIQAYPHKAFYLNTIMTGMGFGPQFRSVHPFRKGDPLKEPNGALDCCCLSVSQLQETEDWQQQLQYRGGIMDSGLQVGGVLGFP